MTQAACQGGVAEIRGAAGGGTRQEVPGGGFCRAVAGQAAKEYGDAACGGEDGMVVIRGVGAAGPVGADGRQARAAGGFRLPQARPAAAGLAAGVEEVGLAGMLALQEMPERESADRQARKRGRDLLAALTAMQRGMLGLDGGDAGELARLAADVPAADDPGLRAAVDAIALRARIELARREKIPADGAGAP
ncbi:MAG: hypothetical protein IT555_17770 [Acetobacteraceae bacterium]|nr:hypothetical protein [Acetobacteraceae bacterium]